MGSVMKLEITARALHTHPHGAAAAAQRWSPESTDRLTLEPAAGKRGRVRVRGAVVPWCRGEPPRNIQLTSPKHGVQQPVRRAQIRSRRGK